MPKRTYSDGKTAGDRIPERSTAGDGKGGKFPDLGGKQSMTVTPNPVRDRKAQRELNAFANEIWARDGEEIALDWFRDIVGALGLMRVIR